MDVLRSCYTTWMRFDPARPDLLIPVEWYFTQPGAKVFPEYHRFASTNYEDRLSPQDDSLGEVDGLPRQYRLGFAPPVATGQKYCGTKEQFQKGVDLTKGPKTRLDQFGMPTCCGGLPVIVPPDPLPPPQPGIYNPTFKMRPRNGVLWNIIVGVLPLSGPSGANRHRAPRTWDYALNVMDFGTFKIFDSGGSVIGQVRCDIVPGSEPPTPTEVWPLPIAGNFIANLHDVGGTFPWLTGLAVHLDRGGPIGGLLFGGSIDVPSQGSVEVQLGFFI